MDTFLDTSVDQMVDTSFTCGCGRVHAIHIHTIKIDNKILPHVLQCASPYKNKKIFLMADANTYSACGQNIAEALQKENDAVTCFVFPSPHPLVPDEKAVGRLLVEIEPGTALIISVGSGTLNDLARMMSFTLHIPYIIIGTAPSMDGYASTVSPLIIDGFKKTFEAVYPSAILCDLEAMKNAPDMMLCAGFGDILGKYTALSDWRLAQKIHGEYFCQTSVSLVENALEKCIRHVDGIVQRDEQTIAYMTEALLLSGIAMGLVGNSRPASGSEHHLAHFWEMDALARGVDHPLHGNMVGVGTVVIASIYEMVKQKTALEIDLPGPHALQKLLRRAGSHDNPADLGIPSDVFKESIIHAKEVRPRYTVLHLAQELGILEEAACRLTEKFYSRP